MKAILFLLLLFSNFSLQGNNPIKFSIELPDTIYKDQHDIPIILKIENATPLLITIKNPKYWGNVFPYLSHDNKDIPLIKARINLRLLEKKHSSSRQRDFENAFCFYSRQNSVDRFFAFRKV